MNWTKLYKQIKSDAMPYLAHFGAGAGLTFITIYVFGKINLTFAMAGGFIISAGIGCLIEFLDNKISGKWDVFDVVSTILGSATVLSVIQITLKIM